jgi:hypothetical protein
VGNKSKINLLDLDTSIPNNFILSNNKYNELSQGIYFVLKGKIKENNSTCISSLYLLSPGIKFNKSHLNSFSGAGCIIEFNIYTILNDFTTGTYIYDLNGTSAKETFDCTYSNNYNFDQNQGEFQKLTNGILTINKIGDEYEIILKSKIVSCYYKGSLTQSMN